MIRTLLVAAALVLLSCACGEAAPTASSPTASTTSNPTGNADVNAAGDIPDTQQFVLFAMHAGGFAIKVPEGWARTEMAGTVQFTSHFDTVTLTTGSRSSAPTTASVTTDELPAITQQGSHVVIQQVTSVGRAAGQAILIKYQADSPPDPVTARSVRLDVERYDFWRNGTEAVVVLAAPVGADNVDPWRTITDSFTWQ
jgi:hypothetical protein